MQPNTTCPLHLLRRNLRFNIITQNGHQAGAGGVPYPDFHEGEAALTYAPRTTYLIQHSAGLRKTKTIAWTAHFFSERHDAEHKKVFDRVIVVSDRTIHSSDRLGLIVNLHVQIWTFLAMTT